MAASQQEASNGLHDLRPSTRRSEDTSIRTGDTEGTIIHKTVLRWYECALMPSIYRKRSFGSFFNREEMLNEKSARCEVTSVMDENAVGWNEVHDPENPMDWPGWKKGLNFFVIFLICFTSPFTSSVFAPAISDMMADFRHENIYLSSFVISVYVLGYAVGPLIIGPLSEVYGRVIMYHVCNIIFVVFTLLCGTCTNLHTLAVMRFFAGVGGSSAFALGPASVADLVPYERRGGMYAFIGTAFNLGPAISPLVGSYLNDAKGWHWIFWLTGIMGAACTLLGFAFLSESYEPVLLRRKVQRLRKETGNPDLYSICDANRGSSQRRILTSAMLRPIKMLVLLPNVFFLSLITAVGYGYMYILYTTINMTFLFEYHWAPKSIGLVYLGSAVGNLLAMVIGGPLSDFIVRRRMLKGDTRPENRLLLMIVTWPLVTMGLIVYGWTAQYQCEWYWPLIGTALFGMGSMSAILFCGTYVVDAYTIHSASAAAATTVLRALFGGLVPLFANKMYHEVGAGWMFTTLGFVALVLWPIPFYYYRNTNAPVQRLA